MQDIATIVSTVGFPIASFLLSSWFIKYSYDKQIESNREADERESKHWEEISKLTTAVSNNTELLRSFIERRDLDDRN